MILNYGNLKLEFQIPAGNNYEIIKPAWQEQLRNPTQEVIKVLKKPTKSPPLQEIVKPGESVCIIVNDPTRLARSEVFFHY
jgi:lactate racemase